MLAHSKPGLQLSYLNAADGVIRDFDLVENSVRDSASDLIRYNISDGVLSSDSRPFSVWEGDGHFPESVGPSKVTNGLGEQPASDPTIWIRTFRRRPTAGGPI